MPSFFDRLKSAFAPSSTGATDRASTSATDRAPVPDYAMPSPTQPSTPVPPRLDAAAPELPVSKVGFSKTGMLHRAYIPRYGNQDVPAHCNLETVLNDVRDPSPEDTDLKRCGRCYPKDAKREQAAPRRRTLARRSPELVYLVAPDADARAVTVKAWFANEYGRIDKDRGIIAVANITALGSDQLPKRDNWVSSKDTDKIYSLHEEVRAGIFELDDAIREAIKR